MEGTPRFATVLSKSTSIVIVGGGVFGLSTALELSRRGYTNITVVDRFLPPVPDGSSVDISRVVRVDYADPVYAKMATEALALWETAYKPWYHRSGFLMLADQKDHPYIMTSKEHVLRRGGSVQTIHDREALAERYPMLSAPLGQTVSGYENPNGGWVDAEGSITHLSRLCAMRGVSFVTGKRGTVLSLDVVRGTEVARGVNVASGEMVAADQIILAGGAWTNRLVDLGGSAIATGQPVGFVQLTAEDAEQVRNMPVCINFTSGVFCFPPDPVSHVLKVARHGYGYETAVAVPGDGQQERTVSSPPLFRQRAADVADGSSYIPRDAENGLRQGLRQILPQFADNPWLKTRLCWYTDTEKGDFIIDRHPNIGNLLIATGGSGHAFKFLPVLGRYIADRFEDKSPVDLREKWKCTLRGQSLKGDGSRGGPPRRQLSGEEQSRL